MSKAEKISGEIRICIEPDSDGFHAFAPDLKGCHVGGATVEEAKRNLDDALHLYLSSLLARSEPLPIGCHDIEQMFSGTYPGIDIERTPGGVI